MHAVRPKKCGYKSDEITLGLDFNETLHSALHELDRKHSNATFSDQNPIYCLMPRESNSIVASLLTSNRRSAVASNEDSPALGNRSSVFTPHRILQYVSEPCVSNANSRMIRSLAMIDDIQYTLKGRQCHMQAN